MKQFLDFHKTLHVLLEFCQNRPKKILFSSRLKKGQIISFLEYCFVKAKLQSWLLTCLCDHISFIPFYKDCKVIIAEYCLLSVGKCSHDWLSCTVLQIKGFYSFLFLYNIGEIFKDCNCSTTKTFFQFPQQETNRTILSSYSLHTVIIIFYIQFSFFS
jgi:hypothetical protein